MDDLSRCELPGHGENPLLTCDEMLDVGLLTVEEVPIHAHYDRLRPYECWRKIRSRLFKWEQ